MQAQEVDDPVGAFAVHGACGDNAAQVALREVFGVRQVPPLRPATR